MKTRQLNAIIASNSATWQKSVQMKQNGKIAYYAEKTPTTHSTAMLKCALNAIKLVTKQKNVQKNILFSVLSVVPLGTRKTDA